MKKSKALALYQQPHKGLTSPKDRRVLIIGLSPDETDKVQYYLNEIDILKQNNQKLKDAINSLSVRRDELKYLKEFRLMFIGQCDKHNIRMTILQCTGHIRKDGCEWKDVCKTRNDILNRLSI